VAQLIHASRAARGVPFLLAATGTARASGGQPYQKREKVGWARQAVSGLARPSHLFPFAANHQKIVFAHATTDTVSAYKLRDHAIPA